MTLKPHLVNCLPAILPVPPTGISNAMCSELNSLSLPLASALYPKFPFYQWYVNLGISAANITVISESLLSLTLLGRNSFLHTLFPKCFLNIFRLFYMDCHFLGLALISFTNYCNGLLTDIFASCLDPTLTPSSIFS